MLEHMTSNKKQEAAMNHQSSIFKVLGNMLEKNEINVSDFYSMINNYNGNIVDEYRKGDSLMIQSTRRQI